MNQIIFIVGVGRSGTSLVQSILSSHSRLGSPPETAFVRRFIAARNQAKPNGTMDRGRMEAILSQDRFLARLKMDWADVLSRLPKHTDPPWEVVLYQIMMIDYLKSLGKKRLIDKDPRLVEFLPTIKRWWPEAFVIHVIRDPRDVLVSKKKAAWSKKRPIIRHIFANLVQLKIGRRLGPELFGNHYMEIIYEKLVQSPKNTIRDICDRLGESFEPAMLDFSETARRLVSPEEMTWKKETMGPILSDNYRKWPGVLDRWEVSMTETACREGIKACGSALGVDGGPRTPVETASRFIGIFMRVTGFIYMQYRLWTQN